MQEVLIELITAAVAGSFIVSGVTEIVKQNTGLHGIYTILFSVALGIGIFGLVAVIYAFPIPESLLLGFLTGLASVGAFNTFKQVKGSE